MNRRSFFKFLGIGAATAAVAPKMLAESVPEYYPEANYPITLKMLQDAYAHTIIPESICLSDEEVAYFNRMCEISRQRFGVKDVEELKKVKRNA